MNFKEAKERLEEIAGDKYRMLSYELMIDKKGGEQQECLLYVDPRKCKPSTLVKASSWEAAFVKLEDELNESPIIDEDIEELKEVKNGV